jgi:molybdopterin-guanine dinucleotide biosynthesis protein A
MGFSKAKLVVDGSSLAKRLGVELDAVCGLAIEVGPGCSGLPFVTDLGGEGPLVAFATGLAELGRLGHVGDVLLLACDLPFAGAGVLRMLASWEASGSIVPVVSGRDQPLCSRWAPAHTTVVPELVRDGERSMRALLDLSGVVRIDEAAWSALVPAQTFTDVDTPADLDRLGLHWSRGSDEQLR